jgi:hypothetical protein
MPACTNPIIHIGTTSECDGAFCGGSSGEDSDVHRRTFRSCQYSKKWEKLKIFCFLSGASYTVISIRDFFFLCGKPGFFLYYFCSHWLLLLVWSFLRYCPILPETTPSENISRSAIQDARRSISEDIISMMRRIRYISSPLEQLSCPIQIYHSHIHRPRSHSIILAQSRSHSQIRVELSSIQSHMAGRNMTIS